MAQMSKLIVTSIISVIFLTLVNSALRANGNGNGNGQRKEIHAYKIDGSGIKMDGVLDDAIWHKATFTTDFLDKEPIQGAQPKEMTEVAIAYDDKTLYVGARMHSADPKNLRMHLDRHDNQGPAEQFIVTLYTYCNRRTGYGFGVNTSGVRFDRYNPDDVEGDRDYSYNPVWEARTAKDSTSWTAEIAIPFSQLRFSDEPEQTWGVNFNRWIPSRNEDVYWIYVPRNETGWASRFGNLTGIEGIKPSRRLEVIPYVASDASFKDGKVANNPFEHGSDITGRAGGDLKMGLGPNLTLDGTINPDFGQVEADPAQVNLSAFEIFYDERRPFFIEGSKLLNDPRTGYFYSRRIGAPPHGSGVGDYSKSPQSTTILGAAKITGQLKGGTSIGILSALTQREYASNHDVSSDSTYRTEIEPAAMYNVARIQQQFGANQSTVGFSLVRVDRDIRAGTQPEALLRKSAFTGGGDWNLRLKGGEYQIYGLSGFSYVTGSKSAMLLTQKSPLRYYQRPDADWLTLDSNRTSLAGIREYIEFNKIAGKHWLWSWSFTTK